MKEAGGFFMLTGTTKRRKILQLESGRFTLIENQEQAAEILRLKGSRE